MEKRDGWAIKKAVAGSRIMVPDNRFRERVQAGSRDQLHRGETPLQKACKQEQNSHDKADNGKQRKNGTKLVRLIHISCFIRICFIRSNKVPHQ